MSYTQIVAIFLHNGRDGVATDPNGLLYMRARFFAQNLRRFVNSDVIIGEISNAITLNRYAYANGNPVSNVDPFGLSAERTEEADEIQKWIDKLEILLGDTIGFLRRIFLL